jgi:hypothetical protein
VNSSTLVSLEIFPITEFLQSKSTFLNSSPSLGSYLIISGEVITGSSHIQTV